MGIKLVKPSNDVLIIAHLFSAGPRRNIVDILHYAAIVKAWIPSGEVTFALVEEDLRFLLMDLAQ